MQIEFRLCNRSIFSWTSFHKSQSQTYLSTSVNICQRFTRIRAKFGNMAKFSWRCSWPKETYKLFVRCVLPILVDETICIRSVSFIQLQNFPRGNQTAPKEMFLHKVKTVLPPKCVKKKTHQIWFRSISPLKESFAAQ